MNIQEEMTIFMLADMLKAAAEAGVRPTENFEKVARARVRMGLKPDQCPCAPKEEGRGCIGPKCLQEIQETGRCHCHTFERSK